MLRGENILRDKIKLNTQFRELVDMAIFTLFVKPEFFLIICMVVLDLNMAIILDASSECWLNDRRAFDFAETVGRGESAGNGGE